MVSVDAPCLVLPLLLLTNAPGHALEVDAVVVVELSVLGGDDRVCMFFEMSFSGTSLRNSS
jgi:hypothetical protein